VFQNKKSLPSLRRPYIYLECLCAHIQYFLDCSLFSKFCIIGFFLAVSSLSRALRLQFAAGVYFCAPRHKRYVASLRRFLGYPTIRPLSFRPRSYRPGHFVPWSFRPRSFRPLVISFPGHFVPLFLHHPLPFHMCKKIFNLCMLSLVTFITT
jgi:hypothetical protein